MVLLSVRNRHAGECQTVSLFNVVLFRLFLTFGCVLKIPSNSIPPRLHQAALHRLPLDLPAYCLPWDSPWEEGAPVHTLRQLEAQVVVSAGQEMKSVTPAQVWVLDSEQEQAPPAAARRAHKVHAVARGAPRARPALPQEACMRPTRGNKSLPALHPSPSAGNDPNSEQVYS